MFESKNHERLMNTGRLPVTLKKLDGAYIAFEVWKGLSFFVPTATFKALKLESLNL